MKDHAEWEAMKMEYHAISVPDEVKNRVEQGIALAKAEESGSEAAFRKSRFFVRFGGCAAAAMVAFTLLVNFNASAAYAMSHIPVLGSIVKIVSFRTFQDTNKEMSATVKVPRVEVTDAADGKGAAVTGELNDKIQNYTDQIIKNYKQDVQMSEGEGREEITVDYEVKTDNDRLYSLCINTEIALNTSLISFKIYHVDKVTGKCITIEDIFKEDSGYLDVLTEEIMGQMRERMKTDEDVTYFLDDPDMPELNWQGLTKEANFYINDKGEFIVVFDKYEVAPGYMGACEFTIPREVIEGIIKPEYLPE